MSRNLLEIVTTGELERVLGWLASVPRERMIESPELCLAAALAYLVAGEAELTELFLGRLSPDHRAIVLACHLSLKERSEEHTSELQSLMRISYAVFCLKKTKKQSDIHITNTVRPLN